MMRTTPTGQVIYKSFKEAQNHHEYMRNRGIPIYKCDGCGQYFAGQPTDVVHGILCEDCESYNKLNEYYLY